MGGIREGHDSQGVVQQERGDNNGKNVPLPRDDARGDSLRPFPGTERETNAPDREAERGGEAYPRVGIGDDDAGCGEGVREEETGDAEKGEGEGEDARVPHLERGVGHHCGEDAQQRGGGGNDVDMATRRSEDEIGHDAIEQRELHKRRQADHRQPDEGTSQGRDYHRVSHTPHMNLANTHCIVADSTRCRHHQGVPRATAIGLRGLVRRAGRPSKGALSQGTPRGVGVS